jgi:hypothetical protein
MLERLPDCRSFGMADPLTPPEGSDDARIDINRDADINYWMEALGIDEQQLRNAVKAVGARVGDVRRHIEHHLHRE